MNDDEKLPERINVTKTFLPPIEEYETYLKEIWASGQLTNQGPLLQKFETAMQKHLGINNLQFVNNGTMALQVALRALGIDAGEIITTPFSYVATTSSILWQHCTPVFVDIEPETFCIDAAKIEAAITPETKAIMAVHVFGHPCNIEEIAAIAEKHNLRVIYDGAHAFGVEYKGKSLLSYGDVSVCSFHATKLFHTIEGGCIISSDKAVQDKIELIKRFGHNGDEHHMLGINAKASEFQAAMGLCNLKYVDGIIRERQKISATYDRLLGNTFQKPAVGEHTKYNYSYYPILLENESRLHAVMKVLGQENIFPRRYFYPSLNTLPYIQDSWDCPVSEDIANRVMCLPLYAGLENESVEKICMLIKAAV